MDAGGWLTVLSKWQIRILLMVEGDKGMGSSDFLNTNSNNEWIYGLISDNQK
jgi:hypothetical protein